MSIYDPGNNGQNSSKGAMVQANMYAWAATGLGRIDIQSEPDIKFEYIDMQEQDKTRIINPLAHIQFATGLRPVRGIFSKGGVRYTDKNRTQLESVEFPSEGTGTNHAGNPLGLYEINTLDGNNRYTPGAVHEKFLLKPKIDNFTLVPKLVADAESVNPTVFADSNTDEKAEFIRTSYVNFVLDSTNANTGRCAGADISNTDNDSTFYVYDLTNNGDDGSYNVIATFKIYAKYNDDNSALTTTKVWPGGHLQDDTGNNLQAGTNLVNKADDGNIYRLDGIPIKTYTKDIVDVSFIFNLDGGENGGTDGLKKKNTTNNTDVSYVAHLMSGNLTDLLFTNGGKGVKKGDTDVSFVCTRAKQIDCSYGGLFDTAHTLDFSFTGLTLEDTASLELNDDLWIGDLILPITGDASGNTGDTDVDKALRDTGGLQCIHIPDSVRTLRNDAAQSLAANFAGLSELLGSISIQSEPDISMGEFNLMSYKPTSDPDLLDDAGNAISGNAASTGSNAEGAHGVFTISGDILSNKLKNFMIGYNDTNDGASEITQEKRQEHIHKVVYWSTATTGSTDCSLACTARDENAVVPDVSGGEFHSGPYKTVGTDVSCGAYVTELTPQESAFFYVYPWASTEMCAISSATGFPVVLGRRNFYDGETDISQSTVVTGADDLNCNPFRQYQVDYLADKAYGDAFDFTSLTTAVPTVKGWMDNTNGYYNTAKARTEWYSFVDICMNNNLNGVQTTDISYSYQDLGTYKTGTHEDGMNSVNDMTATEKPNGAGAKGAFNKSVLDIVFPDVTDSTGALLDGRGVQGGTNPVTSDDGADYCTLNFRVPLQATSGQSQKRLDKVSNLNNGVVQLANESHVLKSGFTAKVNAKAEKLSAIAANVNELMNSYCPVIIRLMDEDTIGGPGHNGTNVDPAL